MIKHLLVSKIFVVITISSAAIIETLSDLSDSLTWSSDSTSVSESAFLESDDDENDWDLAEEFSDEDQITDESSSNESVSTRTNSVR